jgi:CRISPR/Cas system-associated exonuclease Cas4 (RecB family)
MNPNDRKIQWRSQYLEINPTNHKLEEPKLVDEYEEDGEFIGESKKYTLTSFGLHEVDDALHPLREFQVWIADTNFGLTNKQVKLASRINGVEIFKPITRYKFLVAVGKLFDFSEVRVDIEYLLLNKHKLNILMRYAGNEELKNTISEIKKLVDGQNVWAAYIMPNGKFELAIGTDPLFKEKCDSFLVAKPVSNGIIIHS